jgi:hypothetical protein
VVVLAVVDAVEADVAVVGNVVTTSSSSPSWNIDAYKVPYKQKNIKIQVYLHKYFAMPEIQYLVEIRRRLNNLMLKVWNFKQSRLQQCWML